MLCSARRKLRILVDVEGGGCFLVWSKKCRLDGANPDSNPKIPVPNLLHAVRRGSIQAPQKMFVTNFLNSGVVLPMTRTSLLAHLLVLGSKTSVSQEESQHGFLLSDSDMSSNSSLLSLSLLTLSLLSLSSLAVSSPNKLFLSAPGCAIAPFLHGQSEDWLTWNPQQVLQFSSKLNMS